MSELTYEKVLFQYCTQEEYEALSSYSDYTLYFITDTNEIYRGTSLMSSGREATASNSGLLSDEDYTLLHELEDSLVTNLTAADDSMVVTTEDDTTYIQVNISAEDDNIISVEDDGIYAPKASFEMLSQDTPDDDDLYTYYLQEVYDGESSVSGVSIHVPKDYVLTDVELSTVTSTDKASGGTFADDDNYSVGDQYLDFSISYTGSSSVSSHIYCNINDIYDSYSFADSDTIDFTLTDHSVTAIVSDSSITADKLSSALNTSIGYIGTPSTGYDTLQEEIEENTANIETLNGSSSTEGSVAYSIASAISSLSGSASQAAKSSNGNLYLSVTTSGGEVTSISGSISSNTYDEYGAASAVKTELLADVDDDYNTLEKLQDKIEEVYPVVLQVWKQTNSYSTGDFVLHQEDSSFVVYRAIQDSDAGDAWSTDKWSNSITTVFDAVLTVINEVADTKVDKVSGMGLSTNDFTNDYVSKLDGIESGAQVNTVTGVKGDSETSYRTGNVSITADNIGLGNVDNTSDTDKPISTATQTALDLKADIDSPTFTGTPKAPTASEGDSSTQIATTAFVSTAVSNEATSRDTAIESAIEALDASISQSTSSSDGLSLSITEVDGIITSISGTISIDDALSSTSTKAVQNSAIYSALEDKVDVIEGKGLSTNDFTDDYQTKLDGIEDEAQVNIIEVIKVNDTELDIEDKTVNIDLSDYANIESYLENNVYYC